MRKFARHGAHRHAAPEEKPRKQTFRSNLGRDGLAEQRQIFRKFDPEAQLNPS